MHLSFVTSSLQLSGGVQVVVEYANRLVERGHQVSIVTPRKAVDPTVKAGLSIRVALHESKLSLSPHSGLVYQAGLAFSLAWAVPASDVVIATHAPTIVPTIMATFKHPRRRLWLYMDYPEMFEGRPIELGLLKYGPACFDQVLTLSEASRQDALRSGAKTAQVVGLGLSTAELFVPRKTVERRDDPVVMYLGDARPRKGLTEFLAAAELVRQNIPNLRLQIVSKEPLPIALSPTCQVVLGPERGALPDLYRNSDVFVFSSWSEGFGLPPLEAMACGVPVVLTDSRGVREYARSGENCLMVPPRDPVALAEAMLHVLTDTALAERLRRNGPPTAARFTWGGAVDRFENALSNLSKSSAVPSGEQGPYKS